jgi:zinc finger MYND domain-containing protein 10
VLGVDEAERYVEGLKQFEIADVGSSAWLDQHQRIVKLNLQAHQSAMARSDEFVLEALQTFNKVGVLVHELLLIEAWKEVR